MDIHACRGGEMANLNEEIMIYFENFERRFSRELVLSQPLSSTLAIEASWVSGWNGPVRQSQPARQQKVLMWQVAPWMVDPVCMSHEWLTITSPFSRDHWRKYNLGRHALVLWFWFLFSSINKVGRKQPSKGVPFIVSCSFLLVLLLLDLLR